MNGDGAARALWIVLATLAAARAALAFVPDMWGWGLNLLRFLPPVPGWGLWAIAAVALLPPVASRASPAFARAGDALTRRPAAAAALAGALAAALVWLMPDRVRFVGDFLFRQGAAATAARTGVLMPQAFPLDVYLHYQLPIDLARAGVAGTLEAARLIGAFEAGLLAAIAVGFARALELRGTAALAVAASVFFGGYLALFTGYSKAFVELSVLTAAVGLLGLRVLRWDRGMLPFGLAMAAALAIHRSALALLPCAILVWLRWIARHGLSGLRRDPAAAAGLVIPLGTLVVMLPRLVGTLLHFDLGMHLLRTDSGGQGPWQALFSLPRPVDDLNLILLLAPLALAIPCLAPMLRRRLEREPSAFFGSLVLPFLALILLVRPLQGVPRDWDVFAAGGVALSLAAAWLVGELLRAAPQRVWLGVAVSLAVALPAIQWLEFHTDPDHGIARARALAGEAPPRGDRDRGTAWDYVGIRSLALDRAPQAAQALAHAAEFMPSPRILMEWAYAESRAGDLAAAQNVYRRLVDRTPEDVLAWKGLAMTALQRGDTAVARRGAQVILHLAPGDPLASRVVERLESGEGAAPGATKP